MSGLVTEVTEGNVLYLNIIGGSIVKKAEKDEEGARKRVFKDDDGNEHIKYDKPFKNLTGHIVGMDFSEGKFGEQFTITVQNGEAKAKLKVSTNSDYFTEFAKRLPNVDLTKTVVLNAYDVEEEGKRNNRGISIKQDGEKLKNAYWNGTKVLGGMPNVSKEDSKDYDSDDWKVHFIQVRKFLKKKVQGLNIPTYTPSSNEGLVTDDAPNTVQKEQPIGLGGDNNDDLPF